MRQPGPLDQGEVEPAAGIGDWYYYPFCLLMASCDLLIYSHAANVGPTEKLAAEDKAGP
jgi:hypothetical protein